MRYLCDGGMRWNKSTHGMAKEPKKEEEIGNPPTASRAACSVPRPPTGSCLLKDPILSQSARLLANAYQMGLTDIQDSNYSSR